MFFVCSTYRAFLRVIRLTKCICSTHIRPRDIKLSLIFSVGPPLTHDYRFTVEKHKLSNRLVQ